MTDQKQQGRELMRRVEDAARAARVAENLRRMLTEAKSPEDVARVKEQAHAMQEIYPAAVALFSEIVADVNRLNGTGPASAADVAKLGERIEKQGAAFVAEVNARAAKPAKRARKVKDTRPRWGEDDRHAYNRKLQDLIAGKMSDREAARAAIKWAAGNPKLAQCKTPSESALQKWAAAERALMARKRKRS